ncbi:MAG: DUF58 domain-containing protein [Myxococcota bacterium]
MSPSPRFLVLLFLSVAAAIAVIVAGSAYWPVAALTWGVLGLALAFDALIVWQAKPELAVSIPKTAGVGADLDIGLALTLKRGPLPLTIRTEVESPLGRAKDARVKALAGSSTHRVAIPCPLRGEGRIAAFWTRLEGPLRLAQRVDRHAIDETVTVVPNAERIRSLAMAHFGAQRAAGSHLQRRVGDGGELDSLEAYEPGMDLRKVDWKSTARHQKLQVRRFRVEQNQRVVLCVDTGRLMAAPIDGVQRLDHAIHALLLLSRVALRAGDRVGLQGYDAEVRGWSAPSGGLRQLGRLRRAVATLKTQPVETNHVVGVHHVLGQLKRRSLIVVFTDFADSTSAELMVEHLAHLARKHLVVFVAFDDPIAEGALTRFPKKVTDLTGAVVGGELRRDRARVIRRLK